MSGLLDKLQSVGKLHDRGEFTLDVEAAGSKMARFQFREESEFLSQLVAGLFRLGAASINVKVQGANIQLELPALAVDPAVPSELFRYLLDEDSPWRRLAAATQAILAHSPGSFLWLGKNQRYDLVSGENTAWTRVQLREIQLAGLPEKLVRQAVQHLREQGQYARRPLTLDGKTFGAAGVPHEKLGPHLGMCGLDPELKTSRLTLVVDEIATDPKQLDLPVPWHGTFHWTGAARLDASLAAVVEDESYQELIRHIPATFGGCVQAALGDPLRLQNQRFRQLCFGLLKQDEEWPWLRTCQQTLRNIEFFEDQSGGRWSLVRLLEEQQPLYHSRTPPRVQVDALVLVEPDAEGTSLLFQHLQSRLCSLTELVLEQLLRETNQRRWRERKPQLLDLPPEEWLLRRTFETDGTKVVLGISSDWSRPGGTLTILHQGKFLVAAELAHPEIGCTAVAEVPESEISERWDELKPGRLERLCTEVKHQLDGMLKEVSSSEAVVQLGPLRKQLLSHLARSRRPEDSHFARTLLFSDVQGNPHSLFSLLEARSRNQTIGWIHPDHPALETFPACLLPDALWLVGDELVWRCLSQVSGLNAKDLNSLLNDLWGLRRNQPDLEPGSPLVREFRTPEGTGKLRPLPRLGAGEVQIRVGEYWLERISVPSELCFECVVETDKLKFNIRLDSQPLGAKRWSLISNQQAWKKLQTRIADALNESLRSLEQLSPEELERDWHELIEPLLLLGWGKDYPGFQQVRCLHTFPERSSIAALKAAERVYWTTETLDAEQLKALRQKDAQSPLWTKLSVSKQQSLARAHPEIVWECLDEWLEKQARLAAFLQTPMWNPKLEKALVLRKAQPPLQGVVAFQDPAQWQGRIQWLHLQRPLQQEVDDLPPGVRAFVEHPDLEPNEDYTAVGPPEKLQQVRDEVRRQMSAVLREWLSEPQPAFTEFIRHWFDWVETCPDTLEKLREQPWFQTTQGFRSWNELMKVETLYRLERGGMDLPEGEFFMFEHWHPGRLLDSLFSLHPNAKNRKESERHVEEWDRQRRREKSFREQQQRLKKFPRRVGLQAPLLGELALTGRAQQDCFLVLPHCLLRICNLPPGVAGYLETDDFKLKRLGSEDRAELKPDARFQALEQLIPLVLKRIDDGGIKAGELVLLSEYLLDVLYRRSSETIEPPWRALVEARFIPLADGSRTSLEQLRLEAEEQKGLYYWPRTYPLAGGIEDLVPILSCPQLLQLVTRWCNCRPVERAKPLLYRDVSELARQPVGNFRQVLQGLGQWLGNHAGAGLRQGLRLLERGGGAVREQVGRFVERQIEAQEQVLRKVQSQQRPARSSQKRQEPEKTVEQPGKVLLTALRRVARSQLNGTARRETMGILERARWAELDRRVLWTFPENGNPPLLLNSEHPFLQRWTTENEPPAPVVLSLLLGLVSAINARSTPFTDAMEMDFLNELLGSVVSSYRDQIPTRPA